MYNTLEEIDARKAELNKQLEAKTAEIAKKWDILFHPAEDTRLVQSPTERFITYAQKSAGIIDGALLGWKLYRKFFSRRRRR